ncbi:hypothetical protein LEP1GSC202_0368 [Leptospira yanagawae serovar Saopaulo str. Sao Paulo = ATCC 700523]|uniref:Uncharacterized protein n=1 Tax=Leptospira yanagawae serovar Saopaulo str. Sao Paulo = ATCC 700523 TaxID=1249483 RepID=A0A5E8HJU2_9LEPT|nr:hypothetical protein [Leptospira yanagawae]EOQ90770.1 hypothetical protein LEP1GSC202_0368 [Leptospira yanagawae serovar Saopaulo str. Sao Paulo = ATCC 700523]
MSRSTKERAVDLLVEEGLSLNRSLDVVLLPKSRLEALLSAESY